MEVIELDIIKPVHGGYCLAHYVNTDQNLRKTVLVRYGLAGEKVLAEVTEKKSKVWFAQVVKVLLPSKYRINVVSSTKSEKNTSKERCEELPWYQQVGGLELLHVDLAGQIRWKESVLLEQIQFAKLLPLADKIQQRVGRIVISPKQVNEQVILANRTRASFVVDEHLRLAMHSFRSHKLVAIPEFPLLDSRLGEIGLFDKQAPWQEIVQAGDKVQVVVSATNEKRFIVNGKKIYDAKYELCPTELITETVGEFTYCLPATGFWQIHRNAPSTLTEIVLKFANVQAGEKILELYSGAGLFTLPLAKQAGKTGEIYTIEANVAAVGMAQKNWQTAERKIGNLAPIYAQSAVIDANTFRKLPKKFWNEIDLVVLDPPREGASKGVLEQLHKSAASRMVIVGCEISALMRDVKRLVGLGWKLEDLQGIDIFPGTHHVETVCLMTRVR